MLRVICLLLFSLLSISSVHWFFCFILGFLLFFLKYNYFFCSGGSILCNNLFFLDYLSYYFVFLTFIIFIFVYFLELVNFSKLFVLLRGLLFFSLLVLFVTKTWIYFLVFFEASFIFMFLVVIFWGNNPERIEALNYFIIYSLVGSVPILIVLIHFFCDFSHFSPFFDYGHTLMRLDGIPTFTYYKCDYKLVKFPDKKGNLWRTWISIPKDSVFLDNSLIIRRSVEWGPDYVDFKEYIFAFGWLLVFLIKFPIFGLHLWLPKAHVESPVFGSMILAGILIKLRVYGIIRFVWVLIRGFYYWKMEIPWILKYYACFGLIIVKFICRVQWDLKSFVAYSSVVHMSLIIFSILSGSFFRVLGAVLMSFSHGICSSSLFMMVKRFYTISLSRRLYLNRGYLYLFPYLCLFWFLLVSSNCSIPIGLKFFSELFLIFSGVLIKMCNSLVFIFNIFFCGLYCIFLYLYVSHGKRNKGFKFNFNFVYSYTYLLLCVFHFLVLYLYITVVKTVSLVL